MVRKRFAALLTLYDGAGAATVRLYTDTFTGKMVIHCHILEHEDQGKMGLFQITGTEGATYAAATPTDPAGDPLLANWTKNPSNPILNGTADDPSTAWRTAAGEWRLIGNSGARGQRTKGVAPVFATSGDPLHGPWRFVGDSGFPAGECPSLFPLPRLTNGTSAPAGEAMPTHVYHRGYLLRQRFLLILSTFQSRERRIIFDGAGTIGRTGCSWARTRTAAPTRSEPGTRRLV